MADGWKCPGCGKCYAPFVAECGSCNSRGFTTPFIAPSPSPTAPPVWGTPANPGHMDICGCPVGTVCGNTACPHLMGVTSFSLELDKITWNLEDGAQITTSSAGDTLETRAMKYENGHLKLASKVTPPS